MHLNLLVVIVAVALSGCASSRPHVENRPSESRTVAAILAVAGAGPVAFKDAEAAKALLSSIKQAPHLKLALLLDGNAARFAEHTLLADAKKEAAILEVAQRRIAGGESEFEFREQELNVSVVPIREQRQVIGYAAVASL